MAKKKVKKKTVKKAAKKSPAKTKHGKKKGVKTLTSNPPSVIRKSAAAMTAQEWSSFKSAVTQLINNGMFLQFRTIHQDMKHDQHGMGMSQTGYQRFLPWHRDFLLKFEAALRVIDNAVFVPYWDWTTERQIPAELQNFTGIITNPRTPGSGFRLPTQHTIKGILDNTSYTTFTHELEDGPHNSVHNWVGGDMGDPSVSPGDPIFWLHHANIDRLWNIWQAKNPGKMATLSGAKRILDPWGPDTINTVNDMAALGYAYK